MTPAREIPETTQSFSRGPNRVLLPKAEFERLRREGRCFKCKAKGHLGGDCEDQQKYMVEQVEAQAVRFTAYETEEDSSGSEDDAEGPSGIGGSSDSEGTNGKDESEPSQNSSNYEGEYSDSSEEYWVGAMRLDLRSNGGRRFEGGRVRNSLGGERRAR
jgi:hypothetical protein